MNLVPESIVKMHPLASRVENEEETLIGRPDVSDYIILPTFAVDIIHLLDEGHSIQTVANMMEERFGEPVDVLDFVRDLITEYQFVYTVDGTVVNETINRKDHFSRIPVALCKFLFHPVAFCVYVLVFLSAIGVMVSTGRYLPVSKDLFPFDSVFASVVTAVLTEWVFVFLHEMGHLMSVRSLGVGARLGLGHRLVFPVAETNMSNIVLVERKKRYRAYFAGMALDAMFWGIGTWLLFLQDQQVIVLPTGLHLWIKLLNLNLMMGIAFQFMFFMKTDVYYAFTNWFSCNNLLDNTNLFLRRVFNRMSEEREAEWETVAPHEKRIIRWYVWFYVVGIVWAVLFFLLVTVPVIIQLVVRIAKDMSGHAVSSWPFLDGVLVMLLILLPLCVLIWSWVRTWRTRRQTRVIQTDM